MKRLLLWAAASLSVGCLPVHGGPVHDSASWSGVVGFFQSRPAASGPGKGRYVRLHLMASGPLGSKKVAAKVEAGPPGRCSARLAGFGQYSGNTLVITPYQGGKAGKDCTITATLGPDASMVRLQPGEACTLFQNPSCRWQGDVAFQVNRP